MDFFGSKTEKNLASLRQELGAQTREKDALHQEDEALREKLIQVAQDVDAVRTQAHKTFASKVESERTSKKERELMKENYEAALREVQREAEEFRREAEEAGRARLVAEEALEREQWRLAESTDLAGARLNQGVERAREEAVLIEQEAQRVRSEGEQAMARVRAESEAQDVDLREREKSWMSYEHSIGALAEDHLQQDSKTASGAKSQVPVVPPIAGIGGGAGAASALASTPRDQLQAENARLRTDLDSARADLKKLEGLRKDVLQLSEELLRSARGKEDMIAAKTRKGEPRPPSS